TLVAGSTAVRPTAGGDFGLRPQGGTYIQTAEGTLLLSVVTGADANGVGGTVTFPAGSVGAQQVTLDTMSELPISSGTSYAVYEVVDSNPATVESAQFPAFLGMLPDSARPTRVMEGRLYLAAQSTVATAASSAPIPRFAQRDPDHDCTLLGDCLT